MLYSILLYEPENVTDSLPDQEERERIAQHQAIQDQLRAAGKLGPVVRLAPSRNAATTRTAVGENHASPLITIDGPFAETKEQLVGFYLVDVENREEALNLARLFPHGTGSVEVRPVQWFDKGQL